ncbi:hypothetical protein LSTR_LSTR015916 [Laodelphax striatellus]|uniref:Uncharacterized protein n=1 Tax=Laodelphax striatellus TaxID=195883 RepID=A0A482XPI5_LAOST|nr:hypothetical protein LSTR_LSTR009810 [Laodelphax striatellus]RZF48429.1 hypothetical protein LSTR_LSTR015916 [Laodelphax striatellus]
MSNPEVVESVVAQEEAAETKESGQQSPSAAAAGASATATSSVPVDSSESADELGAKSPNFSDVSRSPKLRRPDTPIGRRLSLSQLGHTYSPPTVEGNDGKKASPPGIPTRGPYCRGGRRMVRRGRFLGRSASSATVTSSSAAAAASVVDNAETSPQGSDSQQK